jgi:hypothetical protein
MIILKNGMSDKEIITLTKADLFVRNVGTPEQINLIIEEIKSLQHLNPDGIDRSNIGCWRWNNPCKNIDWLMNIIIDMLDCAVKVYKQEDKTFANRTELDLVSVDYWANVNLPRTRNAIHSHKPAQFSACYYLQAEGTGGLRFINPANIMAECNPGSPFIRDFRVLPKDGDLLLWPAWMPHEVETNFSNKERINLAFDLKVVE